MARKDTKLESEGAEFLVLGQLLIEKIPAYKAYVNFPGYDLIATSEDGSRVARIQVKSRWARDARHILVKSLDFDFLVLVRLNRGYLKSADKTTEPRGDSEYYVLTRNEAEKLLVDRDTGWQKIPWKAENLARYRRRWVAVRDFLKIDEQPEKPEASQHVP
jgi:hypothetical protein